ncbi:FxSxx-COOH system tetratricopeptide repeat protein [Streptomyces sp. NBC_00140]|uniref:FxSxx-COOH system tetratricopeptide repeat protein n=1 Tax=Streptomyces sp. NBC_00140 TaxID=2975664 RepID=UPI002255A54E|nr:FxSxx-COOH system tetratricopeptide repeat protein [Streptomyces sp. NBC_00140]MCX5331427.1 FxSxx-COOH system tetratricopeptide repeat protein [Streptomyces sp. NBC_00140]
MADTYFISYAGADRPWAEWVAWHLEESGHSTVLDVWDWDTGDDFVQRMDEGLRRADAVVALLSTSYFERGRWTQEEWSAVVARRDRLIPLAVEPLVGVDVPAMLAAKIRKNLHGLDEKAAVEALRTAVNGNRRPTERPAFPGNTAEVPEEPVVPHGPKPPLPGGTDGTGESGVWNVSRRRNLDFSGRETQIAQLRDGLPADRHSVVALHGMGGIGKSQIVLEYAYRFAGEYDLVWWIDAEQSDQIPVHYTELADRLGIALKEAGAEHNARTLLTALRGRRRWLIILDNAEDPDQVERWLPEGSGHVLITSRNPNWRRLARPMSLDVFTRADSLAYFKNRVPSTTEDEADALAGELGDLPLALAQAADMIEKGTHAGLYLRLLRENTTILREGEDPDYPVSLAAAVGIAAGNLADEHPDAAALLRLTAFLGPDPIPTDWLVNARARLTTIPAHPDELTWMRSTLEPLRRYSLVRIDGGAFQVHRLTQAVLRDQVDGVQAEAISDDVAAVLAVVAPGDPQDPADWPAWASMVSHLGSRHIDVTHRPELRRTLCDAIHFLIRSAQPKAAAELAATLRDAWTTEVGADDADVLTCMQYLGHATADLGDLRGARPIIEDAFNRRRRTLGDDDPDTLKSANDLAAILGGLGASREALVMYREILASRRRLLGDDHPDTLLSASNFAGSLYTSGDVVAARELEKDVLTRRRRLRGDDHPETLRSAIQLADSLHQLDEVTDAHRLLRETWERCRTTLGDDHPVSLSAARSLGIVLKDLGRHDEARTIIENALARSRRVHGDDHPDTSRVMYALARVLHDVREDQEARRVLVDTIASQRRVQGPDHGETLLSMNQLAISLGTLREFEEARRLLEEVLDRRRSGFGEEHPETLRTIYNLALILHEMRCSREAAPMLEHVLAVRRRTLGPEHKETSITVNALVTVYKRMGMHRQAQKLTGKKGTKRGFRKKSP